MYRMDFDRFTQKFGGPLRVENLGLLEGFGFLKTNPTNQNRKKCVEEPQKNHKRIQKVGSKQKKIDGKHFQNLQNLPAQQKFLPIDKKNNKSKRPRCAEAKLPEGEDSQAAAVRSFDPQRRVPPWQSRLVRSSQNPSAREGALALVVGWCWFLQVDEDGVFIFRQVDILVVCFEKTQIHHESIVDSYQHPPTTGAFRRLLRT